MSIASMADVGVDETVEFISVQGAANHSVFPAYERRDFGDDASTFKGLDPADVLVAFERGRIVGTLGVWDQRRFRQTVVTGYSRSIRVARRLHNGCARLRGQIRLPTAGSVLPVACAAVPVIATGRVDVAAALLDRASSLAGERGLDAILVGSHEQSEWCRPASSSAAIRYDTTVYEVGWNGARAAVGPGVPYLELGVL